MRNYPPCTPDLERPWLSQETRKAASKRFHEMWGAVLKRNGFTRVGAAWYRVHSGQILQGLRFDPRIRNKYDAMKENVRHSAD